MARATVATCDRHQPTSADNASCVRVKAASPLTEADSIMTTTLSHGVRNNACVYRASATDNKRTARSHSFVDSGVEAEVGAVAASPSAVRAASAMRTFRGTLDWPSDPGRLSPAPPCAPSVVFTAASLGGALVAPPPEGSCDRDTAGSEAPSAELLAAGPGTFAPLERTAAPTVRRSMPKNLAWSMSAACSKGVNVLKVARSGAAPGGTSAPPLAAAASDAEDPVVDEVVLGHRMGILPSAFADGCAAGAVSLCTALAQQQEPLGLVGDAGGAAGSRSSTLPASASEPKSISRSSEASRSHGGGAASPSVG